MVLDDPAQEPQIELLYENGAQTVIKAKHLKMSDVRAALNAQLEEMEWLALDKQPESAEENPYLAMAKQQEEKAEAKRKKMLAMERMGQ